ncbi:RelA/SpoT family protein [Brackiella oedipodis]|uniref:RelA/SpoT family protein n=1 Tax=Brackiella oedipodis TaxID=124225 RepID=UPI00048F13B5|nr:bifunctional (p)ppGpp synthetase/guanosine-3',5'-bis(diphosphate) 3'-pyrophosphohydrolase [Brackiella oedipodis]
MVQHNNQQTQYHFSAEWFKNVSQNLDHAEKQALKEAVDWAEPLMNNEFIYTKEPCIRHATGVVNILASLQMDVISFIAAIVATLPSGQSSPNQQQSFRDEIIERFGLEVYNLVEGGRALIKVGAATSYADNATPEQGKTQQEMQRKMLLAMAADLRIVLIRLASRLQSLRWYSESKLPCPRIVAEQTRFIYAPLANRLGIWQIKWELEDLAFRFTEPDIYHDIAHKLESKRIERERMVADFMQSLEKNLEDLHIKADIAGRAKHIYSIYNKMQNKNLKFEQLYDLLAIRIIVANERDCYSALAMVHSHWTPVIDEFDDYIARPKPNGYRSLHTVVQDDQGRNFEVQIRTQQMHEFAEYGMAAHWRYKESGAKGGQTTASSLYDRQISWMRQLLTWRKEVGVESKDDLEKQIQQAENRSQSNASHAESGNSAVQAATAAQPRTKPKPSAGRIYVLTPQAKVMELPEGSTALDFAYYLHTDLGHRCRGAKVDGHLIALNTPLKTGQTVEIVAAKSGGPSRDWLNPQLGYLGSPRARAKVRLWFNAIELQLRINSGQEQVEKELQRLGKTAINLEQLAEKLGFARTDDFYVAVAKDEFSLRNIARVLKEPESPEESDEVEEHVWQINQQKPTTQNKNGVLVVGVDSLMTQLARCCLPAPPDAISGFVTRGRGVSIHRQNCSALKVLKQKHPERIIEVSWGDTGDTVYPVQIQVVAQDRKGLLRDMIEIFSKIKINMIGTHTQTKQTTAYLEFTVEITDGEQLRKAIASILKIPDVISAKRA